MAPLLLQSILLSLLPSSNNRFVSSRRGGRAERPDGAHQRVHSVRQVLGPVLQCKKVIHLCASLLLRAHNVEGREPALLLADLALEQIIGPVLLDYGDGDALGE